MLISPFDHLQIAPDLVCEFFGVFSRLEFALKESTFLRSGRNSRAMPDWDLFSQKHGEQLTKTEDLELQDAIRYLLQEPPQVQVVNGQAIQWQCVALRGATDGARAIDAVQRVRNNLFHGGKHSPPSLPGRDERLVQSALRVLYACTGLTSDLKFNYETSKF